jgi:nucleoside-diphosphate-sugar epimerase
LCYLPDERQEREEMTMDNVLIIGCGDIGRRVARLVRERGGRVTALVRNPARGEELEQLGIATTAGDLDRPETLAGLPTRGTTVCYLAPPPGGGFTDPRVRAFCAAAGAGLEPTKVVYVSTSGVYGDCGDLPVTEETPVNPQTARARRRVDAETTLLAWGAERGVAVVILRVTGIYGPGRLPLERLRRGHPVLRPEEAPVTNRIHADDLARVCLAAADKGVAGEIFNVSDGHPGTMTEYFNAVADALGLPRPPQVSWEEAQQVMEPLMLTYFQERRRLDNRKMRERLGIELRYPTLTEGLRATLGEEKG